MDCSPAASGLSILSPGARAPGARARLLALLVALVMALVLVLGLPAAARADRSPQPRRFLCDGEPLSAELVAGAVDAPEIPNSSGGTVPGAYVVLDWRQVRLQLPRTNNAGAPSFSDGKWWWSLEDPDQPRLRLRRSGGDLQDFHCEAEPADAP